MSVFIQYKELVIEFLNDLKKDSLLFISSSFTKREWANITFIILWALGVFIGLAFLFIDDAWSKKLPVLAVLLSAFLASVSVVRSINNSNKLEQEKLKEEKRKAVLHLHMQINFLKKNISSKNLFLYIEQSLDIFKQLFLDKNTLSYIHKDLLTLLNTLYMQLFILNKQHSELEQMKGEIEKQKNEFKNSTKKFKEIRPETLENNPFLVKEYEDYVIESQQNDIKMEEKYNFTINELKKLEESLLDCLIEFDEEIFPTLYASYIE